MKVIQLRKLYDLIPKCLSDRSCIRDQRWNLCTYGTDLRLDGGQIPEPQGVLYYGLLLGCGGIPYGWTSIVFTDRDVSSVNVCFENSDSLDSFIIQHSRRGDHWASTSRPWHSCGSSIRIHGCA